MKQLATPRGLSSASAGIWREVVAANDFEPHERPILESALRWHERSETWLTESATASGRDKARLVKQALDAAQTSLRHWKALKFVDAEAARRPGRPSDSEWSAKRKAAQLRQVG